MSKYGVILFHTTSSVMRAEKLLAGKEYTVKLIPTPRQFSSDCGIALRFVWSCCQQIELVLSEAELEFDELHPLEDD